jgi:glycosyltransferase involved in cell wall biosynthesis
MDLRKPLQIPRDHTVFLFFGIIRSYKGLDILLEAISQLPSHAPFTLVIAGEAWSPGEKAIRRKLSSLGIAQKTRCHLSWVPEEEVSTWMELGDVVVLPYRSGDGSGVAAHAARLGIPIVGTSVAGLEEVIEEGVNGRLVPPNHAESLALALHSCLDPGFLSTIKAGAKRVAQRHSWESYVDVLWDLVCNNF